jgi:hypothetical protein
VTADPPFPFTVEPSGDGHFLQIAPTGLLAPGRRYALRVEGEWTGDGRSGRVADTIRFRTAGAGRRGPPLSSGRERVSAFRLRRLAVPLPPIIPSLNQIGFDSYGMVVGALEVGAPSARGRGSLLLWAVSTKPGPGGTEVADARGAFAFPLQGRYRHDSLLLSQSGLNLTFSFGDVPMRRFDLRMQLDRRLRARPGASLFAEVHCPDVPNYGPALIAIGLCNRDQILPASGTFVTDRYTKGPANRRPRGVRVGRVALRRPTTTADGVVSARLG